MPIVLYKFDGSPPARAALMTIDILSLNVEAKDLNIIQKEQHKPEYLAKNPLHTVPLLEDGDFILADSHAIITYLVSKYGADKREQLYPNDLRARAIVNQRLYLDASILFIRLRAVIGEIIINKATGPTEQQITDIEEAYGFLEKYLQASPYLAGDTLTLADISCVATVSSLHAAIHPINDKFPKVLEWLQRLEGKTWYQKSNVPGLEMFTTFLENLKTGNA